MVQHETVISEIAGNLNQINEARMYEVSYINILVSGQKEFARIASVLLNFLLHKHDVLF